MKGLEREAPVLSGASLRLVRDGACCSSRVGSRWYENVLHRVDRDLML